MAERIEGPYEFSRYGNRSEEILAVVRETNRIATEGGTWQERADLRERKRALLDQMREDQSEP